MAQGMKKAPVRLEKLLWRVPPSPPGFGISPGGGSINFVHSLGSRNPDCCEMFCGEKKLSKDSSGHEDVPRAHAVHKGLAVQGVFEMSSCARDRKGTEPLRNPRGENSETPPQERNRKVSLETLKNLNGGGGGSPPSPCSGYDCGYPSFVIVSHIVA